MNIKMKMYKNRVKYSKKGGGGGDQECLQIRNANTA